MDYSLKQKVNQPEHELVHLEQIRFVCRQMMPKNVANRVEISEKFEVESTKVTFCFGVYFTNFGLCPASVVRQKLEANDPWIRWTAYLQRRNWSPWCSDTRLVIHFRRNCNFVERVSTVLRKNSTVSNFGWPSRAAVPTAMFQALTNTANGALCWGECQKLRVSQLLLCCSERWDGLLRAHPQEGDK